MNLGWKTQHTATSCCTKLGAQIRTNYDISMPWGERPKILKPLVGPILGAHVQRIKTTAAQGSETARWTNLGGPFPRKKKLLQRSGVKGPRRWTNLGVHVPKQQSCCNDLKRKAQDSETSCWMILGAHFRRNAELLQ